MEKRHLTGALLAFLVTVNLGVADNAVSQDSDKRFADQQRQIDAQAAEINGLKEQIKMLLNQTGQNKELLAEKADKKEIEELKVDKVVTSKDPNVNVTLYGQVNRAGLWADNGDSSNVYFVDNSNSSTRMGVDASAKTGESHAVGSKIEFEVISNPSSGVNQLQETLSPEINVRHADLWFTGKQWGKLAIGRGHTASDGTAEVDLSGTSVVTYSDVEAMAGGQLWYDGSLDVLSEVKVGDVFDNMDGLSRRNRFRYDSPIFAGFTLSGSAIETGAYDFAGRYSRVFGGIKLASALAYASTGDLKSFDNQWSGSLSMLHDSGFNFTLAGGKQDYDTDGRDDPIFWYGKIGYKADLMSFGSSAFSIDYGQSNDSKVNNDEAETLSIAYVQNVTDWGTELYLAWRRYELSRDRLSADDVNALMFGARVKF